MSKYISPAVIFTLLLGTVGCGKTEEAPVAREKPAETSTESGAASSSAAHSGAAKPAAPVVAEDSKVVTYKPVNARLRLSVEPIVILVPDTEDIESGRMLEYREGSDGKYYLKSVIPN